MLLYTPALSLKRCVQPLRTICSTVSDTLRNPLLPALPVPAALPPLPQLIDLGACADLRTGTNYVPEESILDLNYCPPEQFVMPTDSPHLAKQGLLKMAISPMLWAKHKPDRFDTWSAGGCGGTGRWTAPGAKTPAPPPVASHYQAALLDTCCL